MANLNIQQNKTFAVTGELVTNTFQFIQDDHPDKLFQTNCRYLASSIATSFVSQCYQLTPYKWAFYSTFDFSNIPFYASIWYLTQDYECKPLV